MVYVKYNDNKLKDYFLINHVHDMYDLDIDIIHEYIKIHQEIPYVSLSDGQLVCEDLIGERLNLIQRKIKIKKLIYTNK
ncbi:MAG: hypothetical protein ACOC2W_02370 [bacterium]